MKGFVERYEGKVFRVIEKFKLLREGDKVFIALSGGKDSGAAGYMLVKYVREKGIGCELTAFHMNLGLPSSKEVEEVVKEQAKKLNIPLVTCNVADYGVDMAKIAQLPRPICSSCGVIKRYLMNKIPREMGATKVATGHHADDFIVFFFKDILGGNFSWIAKFTPLLPGRGKSIARIRPLFWVGGRENKKFCDSIGLPYLEDACPYAHLKRGKWYEIVEYMASKQPDFRRRMMIGITKLAELLPEETQTLRECEKCGEPTSTKVCAFCRLVQAQKGVKS